MFLRDLLQPSHLIVLLAIYLIFFGSGKLPEFGKQLGSGIKGLKESLREAQEEPPVTPHKEISQKESVESVHQEIVPNEIGATK